MSRPRVAAGALLFDEQGRILLVKPNYKPGWDIPGGYVEPYETPVEACQREVNEELGLSRQIDRLLVVDWAPSDKEGDKILFVFDGGPLTHDELAQVTLQHDELSNAEFFSDDGLSRVLNERLSKRIHEAIHAYGSGDVRYLEHGSTIRHEGPSSLQR